MVEGFAAAAIISSIVQLVDFSFKVVTRINDYRSSATEVPKSLNYLSTQLPELVSELQQIKDRIKNGLLPNERAATLLPVVQGCEKSIADLHSILVKTLPKPSDGRIKKAVKCVNGVLNDGKIDSIVNAIHGYITTLTLSFVVSPAYQPLTSKTIDGFTFPSFLTETDTRLSQIQVWLPASDPSANFDKALSLRLAATGLWLLNTKQYQEWKSKPTYIWLHGIPGCGKTILSSTVLEDVLSFAKDDPGKAVAYFYFDFNDREKQDSRLMVRSLVSQLSRQSIKLTLTLEILFSESEAQRQPSLSALLNAAQQLIEGLPSTYILIDALDECSDRKELLNILRKIHAWQLPGLHMFFISRREGEIENTLGLIVNESNIISIQDENVDPDIRSYIRQRLADDKNLQKWHSNVTIQRQIEQSLVTGAHGMYGKLHCTIFGQSR